MTYDILDFKEFYETPLGLRTVATLGPVIENLSIKSQGQTLITVGYSTPYYKYLQARNHIASFMPAAHGVIHNCAYPHINLVLVDELELPLSDASIDQILLIHCFEHVAQTGPFLREIWRVLKGEGRLIVIVPNRRGLWARIEGTPFSSGQPYSSQQLSKVLKDNLFHPSPTRHSLFMPPYFSSSSIKNCMWVEKIGLALFPQFSGLVIASAQKRLYASPPLNYQKRLVRVPKWASYGLSKKFPSGPY